MSILIRRIFLSAILFSGMGELDAQTDFWNSPQAYLGQARPGDTPEKFAPELINDSPYFSLDRSAFSPDGREFYYCRNNTWFSGKDASIQEYRFENGSWTGPTTLVKQFYGPTFAPGGGTLYFIGGSDAAVRQIRRGPDGWSDPEVYLKRSYGLYDFMPVASGNRYAASNINGSINDFTCYDVGIMRPAGNSDTGFHTLGRPLNTAGFDGDFFVAADESYIVISAKEQPDYECELYISYHKTNSGWTNPKSLGPKINNGPAHRWGEYVTPDNKYLFYSYGHSPKDCALYWVRFDDLLEKLKHSNYDPYVKDSINDREIISGHSFSFSIPADTFFDDDGNGTLVYSAILGDGNALPAWLHFNTKKKIFSGIAPGSGTYSVRVTARDIGNAAAECRFSIKVNNRPSSFQK